jgi:hypothetical protein
MKISLLLALLLAASILFEHVSPTQAQSPHFRHNGKAVENDLTLTPGQVRTTNKAAICGTRTGTIRNVTEATKRKVFVEYGISCGKTCDKLFEVDHLISLEIGGTNDITNLWPQPYAIPGAHQKDVLENALHKKICSGAITPQDAQKAISQDWYSAYQKYVKPSDAKLGR